MIIFVFILIFSSCFGQLKEEEIVSRIESHLSLKDYASAENEAKNGTLLFPNSTKLLSFQILTLLENDQEDKALYLYRESKNKLVEDENFLERFAWGLLKSGSCCSSYPNRLLALLTAQFSSDARSTELLLKMMRDSHALLRITAVRLSSKFQDAQLKDEIVHLAKTEKNWQVRLEVLKLIGQMKEKRCLPLLNKILESPSSLMEEKMAAITSLVSLYDQVDVETLIPLFGSDRASLRLLGIGLALHFEIEEIKDGILKLLQDPISSVRLSALYAYCMHFRKYYSEKDVLQVIEKTLHDADPKIGIISAYTLLFVDARLGYETFFPYFSHEKKEIRQFAAATLSHSGKYGITLMEKIFDNTNDLTVKINLALGLIGQRKKVAACRELIYQFLTEEKDLWMFSNEAFFEAITPSKVRFTPIIPNYPQAIDQMVRIELLSLLAILEDPRAVNAARVFLDEKDWQVKGALAVMLLREGEEDAQGILYKLLEDKDPKVQLRAALILALLTKDEQIIHTLHSFYWGADFDRKLDILEAVGHIGSKESIPFLARILVNPSQKIRLVAASSIIRCLNH